MLIRKVPVADAYVPTAKFLALRNVMGAASFLSSLRAPGASVYAKGSSTLPYLPFFICLFLNALGDDARKKNEHVVLFWKDSIPLTSSTVPKCRCIIKNHGR